MRQGSALHLHGEKRRRNPSSPCQRGVNLEKYVSFYSIGMRADSGPSPGRMHEDHSDVREAAHIFY